MSTLRARERPCWVRNNRDRGAQLDQSKRKPVVGRDVVVRPVKDKTCRGGKGADVREPAGRAGAREFL